MRIDLLVVPDCPHETPARDALVRSCVRAGLDPATITVTVVDSESAARTRGFTGSPTFLLDGVDPFAVPGAPAGLSCRLYPTPTGPAGVPDDVALLTAIRTAQD